MRSLLESRAGNLIYGILFVLCIGALGVISYLLNGWSLGDALYMVVLTVFTVGYEEVRPIDTPTLRVLTIVLIILGCTGMIYLTGALVQFLTFNQLQQLLGLNRMNKQIDELERHVIICGFGRTGSMLAKELRDGKAEVVVIEPDHDRVAEARSLGYLCIHADATEESVLKHAGIGRARALASVVSSDPVNVFITLSARSLNTAIQIIARGEEPSTEKKLLQAGANAVVLPAHIGAEQIASLVLFPGVASMIQPADRRRQMEMDLRMLGLEVEVAVVAEGSVFAGRSVEEIEQRSEGAFFIIAIQKAGNGRVDRPAPTTRIYPGDGVTVLGRAGRASVMEKFSEPSPVV
jgi:Trk K+ transport system NAD-binding subunit